MEEPPLGRLEPKPSCGGINIRQQSSSRSPHSWFWYNQKCLDDYWLDHSLQAYWFQIFTRCNWLAHLHVRFLQLISFHVQAQVIFVPYSLTRLTLRPSLIYELQHWLLEGISATVISSRVLAIPGLYRLHLWLFLHCVPVIFSLITDQYNSFRKRIFLYDPGDFLNSYFQYSCTNSIVVPRVKKELFLKLVARILFDTSSCLNESNKVRK